MLRRGGWRSPLRSAPYPEGPSDGRVFGDLRIALGRRSPVGGDTALCEGIFPDVRTAGENGSFVPPEGETAKGGGTLSWSLPRAATASVLGRLFFRAMQMTAGFFRGFRALAIRGEATTGNVSLHIAPCPVLFVAFQMPHDYVGVYQCPAADGTFALLIPSTDKGGYAFRRPRSTPDVVIVLRSGQRLSPRKTTSSLVNGAEFQSNAFFEVPRASCVRGTGAVCHAAS